MLHLNSHYNIVAAALLSTRGRDKEKAVLPAGHLTPDPSPWGEGDWVCFVCENLGVKTCFVPLSPGRGARGEVLKCG